MSKSLEALERLKEETQPNAYTLNHNEEDFKTIKQDLEYLEQLNKENLDLMSEIQEVHKENLTIKELRKENQELIVNKNVAQAVALNQKREIAELKDQLSYLKEELEGYQNLYEWSQAQNSILKLENEELKDKLNLYENKNKITIVSRSKQSAKQYQQQLLVMKEALKIDKPIIILDCETNQKIQKLEKAIEILKNRGLTLYCGQHSHIPFISLKDCGDGVCISVEEANLLKEVLE